MIVLVYADVDAGADGVVFENFVFADRRLFVVHLLLTESRSVIHLQLLQH